MGANFETVSPRTSDRAHTLRSARQVRYVSSAREAITTITKYSKDQSMNVRSARNYVNLFVRNLFGRQALYPRSKAYSDGVRARFLLRITGYREINPYKSGRAKADAFMLGFTEGGEMEIPLMRASKFCFSRRRA